MRELAKIVEGLNEVLTQDFPVQIALETMAGKGTECGRTFDELAQIIDGVTNNERLSICFDTCHIHDAGYDVVNDFDGVLNEFDKMIGLDRLKYFTLMIVKISVVQRKTVMKILVLEK